MKLTLTCTNCRAAFTTSAATKVERDLIAFMGACCPACCAKAYAR